MATSLSNDQKIVPISEAAKILGVSIDTIRRWDKSGLIHSQRPDGKNRYFSVAELEQLKFKKTLSISEASKSLGISQSTLRRLENKGLIKPERNSSAERVYDLKGIEKFLHSDYFLRQKTIEEKILISLKQSDSKIEKTEITPIKETKLKILNAAQEEVRSEVSKLSNFRKAFLISGLSLVILFILIVSILTILFLLFPIQTARYLGYKTNNPKLALSNQKPASEETSSAQLGAGEVLGTTYHRQDNLPQPGLVSTLAKPFSLVSLNILKQVNPQIYNHIFPKKLIEDVNDVLTNDGQGDIQPIYTIKLPASSYFQVPDAGLISNLNADYLRGKVPGDGEGNLAVFDKGGIIPALVINRSNLAVGSVVGGENGAIAPLTINELDLADNSVTSLKIKAGEVKTQNLANNAVTNEKLAEGSVTSDKIADGTITNSNISSSASISDSKLATISSSNKVSGSAVQLASSGGLTNNSGLSLLTSCSSNQVLAWNGSAWACTTQSGSSGGVTSLNSLTGNLTIAGGGINSVSASGSTITVTGTEADTLASVTGRGATTSTTVALNGGLTSSSTSPISLSSTAPVISIGSTGTLYITNGSNNLLTLADNGTNGTLTVNTLAATKIGAFTLTGNITGSGSPNLSGLGSISAATSSNTINGIVINSGTITGATISGSSNTLSNIGNSSLTNSSITFAADSGTAAATSLGGTRTIAGSGIVTTSISGGTLTVTGTEADTLASVTSRSSTTTTQVALNGGLTSTYSSSTNNTQAQNISFTNSASSGSITVNGISVTPNGTSTSGTNTLNSILLNAPATPNSNTFYGINIGTGYNDILRYNSTQIISGTGILQSAGLSGTYSNSLTLNNSSNSITVGTLTATGGSINGTTIGGTTAAAGTFTSLTANTSASIIGGLNNNSGGITNAGAISGVTSLSASQTISTDTNSEVSITPTANLSSTGSINGLTITPTRSGSVASNTYTINGLNLANVAGSCPTGATCNQVGLLIGTGYTTGISIASGGLSVTSGGISNSSGSLSSSGGTISLNSSSNNNTSINTGSSNGTVTIGGGSASVALNLGSDATGDIYYRNSSGNLSRLGVGTSSQVLGGGATPSWISIASAQCPTCVVTNPTSAQTITNANSTGFSIAQAGTAGSADIFDVTNNGGGTKYFSVDSSGNINISNNANISQSGSGTFSTGTGSVSINGDTTIAANKSLTFNLGSGTLIKNYSNNSGISTTHSITDSASSGTTTVKGVAVNITGTDNSTGSNTITGIDFANVTAHTNNTYYGINFGTGLNDILRYNGNQVINGSGVLQSFGLSGTYSQGLTLSSSSNVFTVSTINGLAITNNGSNTLSIANGKTFTVSNSLTLAGTDSTTMTFPGASDTVAGLGTAQTFTKAQTIKPGSNATALTLDATNLTTSDVADITNATGLASASGNTTSGVGITFTNASSNSSGTSTVAGSTIQLAYNTTGNGTHNTIGINFPAISTHTCGNSGTCNTYGIYFPSSNNYTDILNYNGTSVINSSGQVIAGQITGTLWVAGATSGTTTQSISQNTTLTFTAGTDITTTGAAGSITFADTSTLSTVTGRGASTTTQVALNGGFTSAQTLTSDTSSEGSITPTANLSTTGSVNGLTITPTKSGSAASNTYTINGVNLANVTGSCPGGGATCVQNGINIGTGYTNFLKTANITIDSSGNISGVGTISSGNITAGTYNGNTITSGSGTLTLGTKTLTVNNTMALAAGADSQTFTFPATSDTVAGLGTTQTFTKLQTITPGTNTTALTLTGTNITTNDIESISGATFNTAGNNTNSDLALSFTNGTSNSSNTSTVAGITLTPAFNTTGAGTHNTMALNFPAISTHTCGAGTCKTYGLYFPSSNNYDDILNYNGTSVINSSGQVNSSQLTSNSITINTTSPVGGGAAVSLGGSITITCSTCLTTAGAQTVAVSGGDTTVADTFNVTDSASSGTTTVNDLTLGLTGTDNASGSNTVNALNLSNITAHTNNTYNGLNFGTGYTNLLKSANVTIAAAGGITAGAYNNVTITAPASVATLTIANNKTLTVSNSLTLAGTDSTTMTFPSSSTTVAGLSVAQTFTNAQTISPTQNSVTALTVNGTSGTAATAETIAQTGNASALTISGSSSETGTDLVTVDNQVLNTDAKNLVTLTFKNNNATSTSTTISGISITPTGGTNGNSNANKLNSINLPNVTTVSNNLFYALNVGTGYNDILRYNGNQVINGSGVLQSFGLSGTYSQGLTLSSSSNVFTISTINGLAITNNGTNTLNIAAGKTLTASNSLTLAGTDSTTMTFPSSSTTVAGLGIVQTFTKAQTITPDSNASALTLTGTNITSNDVGSISGGALAPAGGNTNSSLAVSFTNASSNTGATTSTVGGITLTGTQNSSGNGTHNTIGLNFAALTNTACGSGGTCNKYGIYFPSSNNYTDILNYNGTSVINNIGITQVAGGGTGLTSGTSGGVLYYSASGTLASSSVLTANQLVLGGGAGTAPSTLGSLGTTTVLHGNASGAPSFSSVVGGDLSSSISFNTTGAIGLNGGFTDNQTFTSSGTTAGSIIPTANLSTTGNVSALTITPTRSGSAAANTYTINGINFAAVAGSCPASATCNQYGLNFTGTGYTNELLLQNGATIDNATSNTITLAGTLTTLTLTGVTTLTASSLATLTTAATVTASNITTLRLGANSAINPNSSGTIALGSATATGITVGSSSVTSGINLTTGVTGNTGVAVTTGGLTNGGIGQSISTTLSLTTNADTATNSKLALTDNTAASTTSGYKGLVITNTKGTNGTGIGAKRGLSLEWDNTAYTTNSSTDLIYGAIQQASSNGFNLLRLQSGSSLSDVFSVTGAGAVTEAAGLTVSAGGAAVTGTSSVSGGAITLNDASNNNVSINTGTSTGTLTLGGGSATIKLNLGSDATGDIYYRNSSGNVTRLAVGTATQVLIGGTTPSYLSTPGSGTQCLQSNAGNTALVWSGCGGSVALNNVSAATGAQTGISNGDNDIVWNWAPSTGSTTPFTFGFTAAPASGTNNGLKISMTNTSNTFDAGLLIDRNGGSGTTTSGLKITNTAGTLTNGITVGSGSQTITTGLNFGSTGITTDISFKNGDTLTNSSAGTSTLSSTTLTLGGSATINGGTSSGGTLTLVSTTNGTKGNIIFFGSSTATLSSAGVLTLAGNQSADITNTGTNTLIIKSAGAGAVTLDTGGAAGLNLGNTNANAVVLGNTTNTATVTINTSATSGTGITLAANGVNTGTALALSETALTSGTAFKIAPSDPQVNNDGGKLQAAGTIINVASTDHSYMSLNNRDLTVGGHKNDITIANVQIIFVYDTTKDSDGGRWTNDERAQSASWYNETTVQTADACTGITGTLSTANQRCGTKPFPAKVIIVAAGGTGSNSLYIIDAKDNSLWMRFDQNATATAVALGVNANNTISSVFALNGNIYAGTNGSAATGLYEINFKTDKITRYNSTDARDYSSTIANRNVTQTTNYPNQNRTGMAISASAVNAVYAQVNGGGKSYVAVAACTSTPTCANGGISFINESIQSVANFGLANKVFQSVYYTADDNVYGLDSTDSELDVWYGASSNSGNNVAVSRAYDQTGVGNTQAAHAGTLGPALYSAAPTINSSAPEALFVVNGTSDVDGQSNTIYIGHNSALSVIQEEEGAETNGSVKYYTSNMISEEMVGDTRAMLPFAGTSSLSANTTLTLGTDGDVSVKATNFTTGSNVPTHASAVRGNGLTFSSASNQTICPGTLGTCATSGAPNTNIDWSNNVWSISFWMKTSTTNTAMTIINKQVTPGSTTSAGYDVNITSSNTVNTLISDGTNNMSATSTKTVTDGNWHHIVAVLNRTTNNSNCSASNTCTLSQYIDGVKDPADTTNTNLGSLSNTNKTVIGGTSASTPGSLFNGTLDEVMFNAAPLSLSEVSHIYFVDSRALNNPNHSGSTTIRNVSIGADTANKLNGSSVVKAVFPLIDNGQIYIGTSGGISVVGMDTDTLTDLYSTSINTTDDTGTAYDATNGNAVNSVSVTKAYGPGVLLGIGFNNSGSGGVWLESSNTSVRDALTLNYDPMGATLSQTNLNVDRVFRVTTQGSTRLDNFGIVGTSQPQLIDIFKVDNNGAVMNLQTMSQYTNTAGTNTITGLTISTLNNPTQNGSGGTSIINGISTTTPNITGTAGTISATGANITVGTVTTAGTNDGIKVTLPTGTGSITTAGTINGLEIPTVAQGPNAGNFNAINIGSLTTAGSGTQKALIIGSNWTKAIEAGGASGGGMVDLLAWARTNDTIPGITLSGTAPGSNSGAGTNQTAILSVTGATGQASSSTGGVAAGFGQTITLTTGGGGAQTGASGTNTGGAGGALTLQTSAGGNATSGTGGKGGSISMTAGNGGTGSTTSGAGGDITLTAGGTGNSTGNPNAGSISIDSGALNSSTGASTITIGGTNAKTYNDGTGNAITTFNIGTGSAVKTIAIGTTTAGTADIVNINNSSTGGSVSIGAALTGGTITIGGTANAMTGSIKIGDGTAAQTIDIGNTNNGGAGGAVKTINIGNQGADTAADVINIGGQTGTVATKINLGVNSDNAQVNLRDRTAVPGANMATNGQIALGSLNKANAGGRIWIKSNGTNFTFQSTNNTIADYSEYLQQSDTSEPGDVMVLSNTQVRTVQRSSQTYDQNVLGVVTQYGTGYNNDFCFEETCDKANNSQWANVGMLGQVYTKVSDENGVIQPGDPLTTSSLTGVAMKSTQAGRIVGHALDYFDGTTSGQDLYGYPTYPVSDQLLPAADGLPPRSVKVGKIVILLQAGWYDPSTPLPNNIQNLQFSNSGPPEDTGLMVNGQDISIGSYGLVDPTGRAWDNTIVTKSATIANLKVGGLVVDTIDANSITALTGTFTTLSADKIQANQIDGLQTITDQVTSLSGLVNNLSNQISTSSASLSNQDVQVATSSSDLNLASLDVSGIATVSGELTAQSLHITTTSFFDGIVQILDSLTTRNLIVTSWSSFLSDVTFKAGAVFEGRPTFNSDTAGFAVIKSGDSSVAVTFDQEYITTPLVNLSITLDDSTNGNPDPSIQATQTALEQAIFNGDIKYIVTRRTTKGFMIMLNKPAPEDLKFSWSALSITNAKTFESSSSAQITPTASPSPSVVPTVSPTPLPSPTPSPQTPTLSILAPLSPQPTITPSPIISGPTPSQSLTVNPNDLGFLKVRASPDINSSQVGQVNPGQTFTILASQSSEPVWYEIEYVSGQFGWVSGNYVTIN